MEKEEKCLDTVEKLVIFQESGKGFEITHKELKGRLLHVAAKYADQNILMSFYYDRNGVIDDAGIYIAATDQEVLDNFYDEYLRHNYPEIEFYDHSINIGLCSFPVMTSYENSWLKIRINKKGRAELY